MEDLVPIINRLQDLASTTGELNIKIPQIVVVGEQSSGKSSVLESLIGRPVLPRGSGIVTRCPIVIQLNHVDQDEGNNDDEEKQEQEEQKDSKCEIKTESPREWCLLGDRQIDFNAIANEVQQETNKLAGTNKNINSTDSIILKIFSPNIIDLTLVDLPGIVKNPVGDQPVDIEEQVRELLMKYIGNPNSIILAVCMASVDLANSEAIKMAKLVDPEGNRTIVVLTKLDLMDRGTDATDVLSGKVLEFKLGIIGVVNRGQKDVEDKKSIKNALKDEEKFFRKKYSALASCNGTPYLAMKLQKILKSHIERCLPPLQLEITECIAQTKKELASYGESCPEDKRFAVLQVIQEFCQMFFAEISVTDAGHIRKVFEEDLPNETGKINPAVDLDTDLILETLNDHEGIESFREIPGNAFRVLAKSQIRRLEDPALKCANLCHTKILELMQTGLQNCDKVNRFPMLKSELKKETEVLLEERHEEVQQNLRKYVKIQSCLLTVRNPEMAKKVEKILDKHFKSGFGCISVEEVHLIGPHLKSIQTVRSLVTSYYDSVARGFSDYCQKVVAYEIIDYLKENLQNLLIGKVLSTDAISRLVKECPTISKKREAAKRRLEEYEKANNIIGEIRDVPL